MHVGIIIDELAPGSAPKLSGLKSKYLKKAGNKVTLFIIYDNGSYQKNKYIYDQFLKNTKIVYIMNHVPPFFKKINFKFPFMSFFSLHHLIVFFFAHRCIKNEKVDLLIACCQYTSLAALNLLKKFNIPYLLLIWDPSTFIAKKIYKQLYPFIYPFIWIGGYILDRIAVSKASALITSSKYHHKNYKNLTSKPLEILHLGCFPNKVFKKDYSKGKIILTFDRWDIGNNPSQLLDILYKLNDKTIKLFVGGYWYDKKIKNEFQSKVMEMKLNDRVKYLGPLNESKIKYYSKISTINIHHIHDAFATTILECSGYCCPGIVVKGTGVDEIFNDNQSILIVKDTLTNTFVKRLNNFFSKEKLIKKITYNAWKIASKNSWEIRYRKDLNKICHKYIKI
jgi:glycosyltransferase involved in cell wall biosynthesis